MGTANYESAQMSSAVNWIGEPSAWEGLTFQIMITVEEFINLSHMAREISVHCSAHYNLKVDIVPNHMGVFTFKGRI